MKKILSQHFFKRKIKEKKFEFEEELNIFKVQIENETTLKNEGA